MYKKNKMSQRRATGGITVLNETSILLDRALRKAAVPPEDREKFLEWTVASLWQSFMTERMNQRIIIENEIKALGLHLPNGTVRKDYVASLRFPLDKISEVRITGMEELGLTLLQEEDGLFTLTGKPVKVGDFTIRVSYSTVKGEPRSLLTIPVAFNSNPRDLWQDKPTPTNIDYYKEDAVSEYVEVKAGADGKPRKDMLAASKRGRSHAHEGKPRDDHFRLYYGEDSDWYVMAVADGAGSARYSREGSRIACDTVTNHCKQLLNGNVEFENSVREWYADQADKERRSIVTKHVIEIVYRGALAAYEAVRRESLYKDAHSRDDQVRIRDYATTLMFVICKKFDFGWFMASFWVGDGAMCLFDAKNKTAKLLGTPDEGEFSGQTRFLTMFDIFRDREVVQKRMRMAVVPDFTALFLMTDGISDPMFSTEQNLRDYAKWEEFYEKLRNGFPEDGIGGVDLSDDNPKAADELLRWLDFWSQGNHDDRTLAILY